jgi:tRNA(Ile2) C34 agmatinyltransferase TiaS
MNENIDTVQRHPLATATGVSLIVAFLLHDGAMCPKCGHGTRATSKRWARCKRCGERVRREVNAGAQTTSGAR